MLPPLRSYKSFEYVNDWHVSFFIQQAIQRQLEEVGEKQRDLEERGVAIEKIIRGETGTSQHMQSFSADNNPCALQLTAFCHVPIVNTLDWYSGCSSIEFLCKSHILPLRTCRTI